jgi:hypothetical protein
MVERKGSLRVSAPCGDEDRLSWAVNRAIVPVYVAGWERERLQSWRRGDEPCASRIRSPSGERIRRRETERQETKTGGNKRTDYVSNSTPEKSFLQPEERFTADGRKFGFIRDPVGTWHVSQSEPKVRCHRHVLSEVKSSKNSQFLLKTA